MTMATQSKPAHNSQDVAHQLSATCFKLGSFTAIVGVSIGIYMGLGQDHTLAPVHVHLNLIGWVSMFLFGLYYNSRRAATGPMPLLQVLCSGVGYVVMTSGLAGLLLCGHAIFTSLAIIGSLLVWSGFALFFAIVVRTG